MMHPDQSTELREKISAMLTEAEITAEELYQMLFGRGKDAPDMPEYSHEQMMSEGTWAKAELGQEELEIVSLHVDLRSALTSMEAAEAPQIAAELSALLGENIDVNEQGELIVKRKFAEWKKGLRAFLSALAFKQLLTIALKLAALAAPQLAPAFSQMKNRPEERKQLEQFVMAHAVDPSPPVFNALAIPGMPILKSATGAEFTQPFRSYALTLNLPELEQARALFETRLSRGEVPGIHDGDLKRELQDAIERKEQKDLSQKSVPDYVQRSLERQVTQQQTDSMNSNSDTSRPPRMKNAFGLSKAARRELKRMAESEKQRDAREKLETPIKDTPAAVNTKGDGLAPDAESQKLMRQMSMREFLRDRAPGNIPGNAASPRTAFNPNGASDDPQPAQQTRSGRRGMTIRNSSGQKVAKEENRATVQTQAPVTREVPAPSPEKLLTPPASEPVVAKQPTQTIKPVLPPEGIGADLLKAFSGFSVQDANVNDLGSKKSSLARDDKIVTQTRPTPQIER